MTTDIIHIISVIVGVANKKNFLPKGINGNETTIMVANKQKQMSVVDGR